MIPEGYRLLTVDDVGKVFGVDLENKIYIDTNVSLTSDESYFIEDMETLLCGDFIRATYFYDSGYEFNVPKLMLNNRGEEIPLWFPDVGWLVSDLEIHDEIEIGDFHPDEEDWNTWFYVKDIANPYNITPSKPKITINCKGKLMTQDLTITRELWDGSYEEIVSGFTLTLEGSYPYEFKYSLDGGNTYTNVPSLPVTIENVLKIKFRTEAGDVHSFNVGTSDGAYDITGANKAGGYGETDEVELIANATWYISKGSFSGGADN